MDLYSQNTNNTINFSGSDSGSGSFYEENNNTITDIEEKKSFYYGILFAISPVICVIVLYILVFFTFNVYYPLKDKIINSKKKYQRKQTEKKLPIYNCKINTFYIKELNKSNFEEVKNEKKKMECSICCEEINIEKFKHKNADLIFLNCSHVYHTKCLQSWVKTRVNDFIKPDCPYCRGEIVEVKQFQNNKIYYDSGNDSDRVS